MFFSVVIPTYNRLPILAKCLKALENQTLTDSSVVSNYEIVVVDDGYENKYMDKNIYSHCFRVACRENLRN